ncbi:MAG: bifunctional isocitrate dehydrogenase kinase/phosphatase [Thiotrichales bacterium]|nr:bifunctional isocitrate dehydrogenase kinase/phosphatase [Thiotrichales bacterium]
MNDQERYELITSVSQTIYDGFVTYNYNFHRITRRARVRFEKRDWQGHQDDIVERVELYDKSVRRIVLALRRLMGDRINDHSLWQEIREYFGDRLALVPDAGFIKTFFNSVTRRIFETVGIDDKVQFISTGSAEEEESNISLSLKRYPYWGSFRKIFETILIEFAFRVDYKDLAADAAHIESEIISYMKNHIEKNNKCLRFEFIDTYFYQSARAYLVGRMIFSDGIYPIVIAFKHEDDGIQIDAVLLTEQEVSIVFGYTRSYYFADPKSVIGAVYFLHSILPRKPMDELYTVLGRLRQGKTERFSYFSKHLARTKDSFVHAAGDKGLVMIVFTLPSYNLVFKIMRDTFGYPKNITHDEVLSKYKLVSKHDRAGRLIDTQEFMKLQFPINRFSDELLDELLSEASMRVRKKGRMLEIDHVYVERRVRPLNLFINEVPGSDAKLAILDYGQALKDLAHTNIFPGDLLLKNFGVTNLNRVIFYDYDEVSLITECNFRDIPESNDFIDDMRADTWYYVGEHDIFPEEFIKFLSMDGELRDLFLATYPELLTADWWREIREKHLSGMISPVVPYLNPVLTSSMLKETRDKRKVAENNKN